MLATALELEDHECVITNDGKQGLEYLEKQKFNTVLLDLSMPNFSGYDIIDALEKKGKLKENKIIVFTASSISHKDLKKMLDRGISDYLLKPVGPDSVLKKIHESQ